MHKEYLEEIHRGKKKSLHWLMTEHNRLFADWFQKKVSFIFRFVVVYKNLLVLVKYDIYRWFLFTIIFVG